MSPRIIALLGLLFTFPDAASGDVSFPEQKQQWDFRTGQILGIPPEWGKPLLPYRITIEGNIRPENRVAIFAGGVDAARKSAPKTAAVFSVKTEAQKQTLMKAFRADEDNHLAWVFYITSAAEKGFELSGVTAATELFLWALDRTEAAKTVRKTKASLRELIAIGGEVIVTEAITDLQGTPFLRKSWVYRIRVGDEVRLVPIAFIYSKAR